MPPILFKLRGPAPYIMVDEPGGYGPFIPKRLLPYSIQVEPIPRGIGIPKPIIFPYFKSPRFLLKQRAKPSPVQNYLQITGVTKDSAGAALGSCTVKLYRTDTDAMVQQTTSDASGNYTFTVAIIGVKYYVISYKAGSPDVTGASANTIGGG